MRCGIVLLLIATGAQAQDPAILQIKVTEGEGAVYAVGGRATRGVTVQVTDETGKPVEAATVSFRLPDSGAAGTFASGSQRDRHYRGRWPGRRLGDAVESHGRVRSKCVSRRSKEKRGPGPPARCPFRFARGTRLDGEGRAEGAQVVVDRTGGRRRGRGGSGGDGAHQENFHDDGDTGGRVDRARRPLFRATSSNSKRRVAHASACRVDTPVDACTVADNVEMSLDTARRSACATFCWLATCGFAWAQSGGIAPPSMGLMMDRHGYARPVFGVSGSVTLGAPVATAVVASACSDSFCVVKTQTGMIAQGAETKSPPGPALLAIDGQSVLLYFPRLGQLGRWQAGISGRSR